MNLKLFSQLIMAHLLSGWCSVLGQDSDEDIFDAKDQKLLKKVSIKHPDVYPAVWNRLIRKQFEMHEWRGRLEEKRRSHEVAKVKNENIVVQIAAYLPIVQGVKLRDWIFAIEKNFPNWLRYLNVNRLIEWVLALKFAEEPIFDDLRRLLKASRELTIDTFANEMYSIYEDMSASIALQLPDVPDPTPDNIPRVCLLVAGNNKDREAACVVLLHALFGRIEDSSMKVKSTSTTADLYPTKFYVIITHDKKAKEEGEFASNKFSKIVESNMEFKKQNCTVLENFTIDHSKIDNIEFGKRQKLNLPTICVVIRMGFPKNILGPSSDEFDKNFLEYMSVKDSIKTDLKNEDPSAEIFT